MKISVLAVIGLTSALILGAPANAVEAQGAPIAKAFPYLVDYLILPTPQRDRFRLAYFVRGKNNGPAPRIELVQNGSTTPVKLGADGRVLLNPDLALLRSDARFVATPKGTASISMRVEPVLPRATTLDARLARESVAETSVAIKKYAGMLGFALPSIKGIAFEGVSSGQAVFADGSKIPLKMVGKSLVYLTSDAKLKQAVRLEFDRLPGGLDFH